jgi:transcriptional regulator with XRE-family HTH domain
MIPSVDTNAEGGLNASVPGTVGERIKQARKGVKLTQAQLASELGIEHMTVSRWERGLHDPAANMVPALAKVLRCDANWLLTGEDPVDAAVPPRPDYPALADFLETDLGKSATPDEIETLRSLRAHDGRPTVALYQTMLLAIRGMMER